jgi:eukaryotic-like serine/threonine-protein kinase
MIQAGTRLGDRYVLVEVVGQGGQGEVWRANDTTLDRVVAVRLFPASLVGPDSLRRFRIRARAIAGLNDPNIVGIYDYGQADGIVYLVMEFVEGESLQALLRRNGPLAPPEAMNLIAQAARALHVAHSHGILHREVKASNLLVRPDGRLLLGDFGLARAIADESIAEFDGIVGCAPYISPEQLTGRRMAAPSTDIYALGAVAFVCLTAEPFPGDDPNTVPPPQARPDRPQLPPHIPKAVRHVVMRALDRRPQSRWASAEAMRAAAATAVPGHSG